MRLDGAWPRAKAGKATEAAIDFSDRGGMLMMRRRISPRRTRSRCQAIASICQLPTYLCPGVKVVKTFSKKALKSFRSRACSKRASSTIAAFRVLALLSPLCGSDGRLLQEVHQNCTVLGQHLFEMRPGLGRFGVSVDEEEQEFHCSWIAAHGVVG